jgi:hypothetical protein
MKSAFLALPFLVACIDTDAAVFVEASVEDTMLAVQTNMLVTGLDGSFRVLLHLGPRASGPSEVGLVSFSVTDAAGNEVVASLAGEPSPVFPVTVGVDADVAVAVAVNGQELPVEAGPALCAGPIVIVATLDDSLRGAILGARSVPFPATGCP